MLNLLAETLRSLVADGEISAAVAAKVFGRVAHGNEHPINTGHIMPVICGDYTFACERLSHVLDEIRPLHTAHWDERGQVIEQGPFNPDYAAALTREVHGDLLLCTSRRDGVLIGSVMYYLHRSTHTQEIVGNENSLCLVRNLDATEDSMFVSAVHRNGTVGIRLFDYGEAALKALGVREATFTTNISNRVNSLLMRRGYVLELNVWKKRF